MVSFAPTSEETSRDQRLYLDARLAEVACLDCLARVRVKKNSEHHTSIQWTDEAVAQCTEFRKLASQPEGRAPHASCPRLRSSIDQAVRDGAIEIGAEDGY